MATVQANLKNLALLQVDASAQHENTEWKQDSPSKGITYQSYTFTLDRIDVNKNSRE
jgi:hypothetical protein